MISIGVIDSIDTGARQIRNGNHDAQIKQLDRQLWESFLYPEEVALKGVSFNRCQESVEGKKVSRLNLPDLSSGVILSFGLETCAESLKSMLDNDFTTDDQVDFSPSPFLLSYFLKASQICKTSRSTARETLGIDRYAVEFLACIQDVDLITIAGQEHSFKLRHRLGTAVSIATQEKGRHACTIAKLRRIQETLEGLS